MEALFKIGIFLILAVVGFWRGRRNERAHLALLAAEEERLLDVLVFSSRYPDHVTARMDPVLVSGSAVMGSDFYRMLIGTLRKVVGGNYLSYERLVERGRRQALIVLKQQAHACGARMVFNVMYSSARISDPRMGQLPQFEVLAYGTALIPSNGEIAASAAHHVATPISELDGQTDLMKNKGSRWWIIGWFVFVLYAMAELLGDLFSSTRHQWRYAMGAPKVTLFVVAVLLTAFIAQWARRFRLRWVETIILSVITAPTLAATFYFLGLRLNALTALQPTHVIYTHLGSGVLHPPDGTPFPTLRINIPKEYWKAQTIGSQQYFVLTRGWLPFWQYDLKPLNERYRSWDNKSETEKATQPKK